MAQRNFTCNSVTYEYPGAKPVPDSRGRCGVPLLPPEVTWRCGVQYPIVKRLRTCTGFSASSITATA